MATVEHADIIDPQIHEPKGISIAAANTVYVANGSASGSWTKIPRESLEEGSVSSVLYVTHTNTVPLLAAGTWTQMSLSALETNEVGATLNTNTLTLPSGTYDVEGYVLLSTSSSGVRVVAAKTRLYSTTSSSEIVSSSPFLEVVSASVRTNLDLHYKSRFTLSGSTNIILQGYINATEGSDATNFSGYLPAPATVTALKFTKV